MASHLSANASKVQDQNFELGIEKVLQGPLDTSENGRTHLADLVIYREPETAPSKIAKLTLAPDSLKKGKILNNRASRLRWNVA